MRITWAILMILASAGLSGCWSFRKKAQPQLPPLSVPVLVLPPATAPVDLPPEATTPIQIEPAPHPPDVTIIKPELQPPLETPPETPPVKPAARKPVPAPAASSTPPATETPTPPPPQLGEMISEERRAQLQNEIEQSLDRARATLSIASQRSLSRRQNETANRIRTFVRQTEDAKVRDISTAVQLARRADLLAQDLAATLQ